MSEPVAVTGLGAITPLGVGADVLYRRLVAGETGTAGGVGRCADFEPERFLTRREARRSARFGQFAAAAADEAVAQAGWSTGVPYAAEDVLCAIGTGLGGVDPMPDPSEPSALTVPMLMSNSAAAQLCIRYGLHGESFAVGGACAAGAQAVGLGVAAIRAGAVAAAIVGGAEAALVPMVADSFAEAGALSPSGRSVPFGAERDGFVMGEGAGVLVLESVAGARARGARILGLVLGYGASSDGHHLTAPAPDGAPAAAAVRRALSDAGVTPDDVCYLNAHGTGTALNDATEVAALRSVLGDRLADLPLSSTKAATGHLFGAGGAVEAIVTLAALANAVAPPTWGAGTTDPALEPLRNLRVAEKLAAGAAGFVGVSTSFGFGGHNAVLVLAAPDEG